jgi:hypothetical protein
MDPSAIPSLITDVSMAIDHSATPPIDVAHINGTSAVSSLMLPERPEPSPNLFVVKPVVSTMFIDVSAAPPKVPSNAVAVEKGPTGMTKKAGIMRPNSHSKTAR